MRLNKKHIDDFRCFTIYCDDLPTSMSIELNMNRININNMAIQAQIHNKVYDIERKYSFLHKTFNYSFKKDEQFEFDVMWKLIYIYKYLFDLRRYQGKRKTKSVNKFLSDYYDYYFKGIL